jgi:glutamyl-tRNA synthetase
MSLRLRYAPSPTGDLHLGSLRTVIFAWLVAQEADGAFILRVEDTDKAREVEGAVKRQLDALHWMGLDPNEGVCLDDQGNVTEKGSYGPYTQSKRLAIYAEHAQMLLDSGAAYRCFCTSERLDEMRAEQAANHLPPRYDRRCRSLSREESDRRAATEPFVIRHAVPDHETVTFTDEVRGDLTFKSDELDDYVLLKSDTYPTYQLASVVDDHLMEITHVLRGEEWLPSLPKNLLLYKAFGWHPPKFAHLPVILGPDGKHKLSKRDGDVSVNDYEAKGYLPDALFNMLAMIGWSPGTEEEFFDRQTLVKRFSLNRVQKAPAAFSFDRLDFVNGSYIRHMSIGEVAERMLPYLQADGLGAEPGNYLLSVAAVLQERLKHFDESAAVTWFFFKRPEVTEEYRALLVPKKGEWDTTKSMLEESLAVLRDIPENEWTLERIDELLRLHIAMNGYKNADMLWPIRAALTGVSASPGAFEMLDVLGREESLARLEAAIR